MSNYDFKEYGMSVYMPIDKDGCTYESAPRNHGDGMQHIGHRFPIVGGITPMEATVKNAQIRLQKRINHFIKG